MLRTYFTKSTFRLSLAICTSFSLGTLLAAGEVTASDCHPYVRFESETMDPVSSILPSLIDCRSQNVCANSLKNPLWAQERVDADLMNEELLRLGITPGSVKIAVIDSGFDFSGNRTRMLSPTLNFAKAGPRGKDPSSDVFGHGTRVASLIGGSGGIGIAPQAQLSIYRLSTMDSEGQVDDDEVSKIIKKACKEGNEIINVSLASVEDESGEVTTENSQKALLKELNSRGCLIVAGAGNAGYKERDNRGTNPDDSFLRVSAIDASGNLSRSSTRGELSAPGGAVFTLESVPAAEREVMKHEKCDDSSDIFASGSFASGTSLSAPITAAIGAQALAVLKKGNQYKSLPGPAKVKLLNRILSASQKGGSVNGLRAIFIAQSWVQRESTLIPEVGTLSGMLDEDQSQFCATKSPPCFSRNSCQTFDRCVKVERKKLALCKTIAPNEVLDLINSKISSQDLEGAAGAIHDLTDQETLNLATRALGQAYLERRALHPAR